MADGTSIETEWTVPLPEPGAVLCPRCRAEQPEQASGVRSCQRCGAREDRAMPDMREDGLDGERVRDLEELTVERDMLARALALVTDDAAQTEAEMQKRIDALRVALHRISQPNGWSAEELRVLALRALRADTKAAGGDAL